MIDTVAPNASIHAGIQFRAHVSTILSWKWDSFVRQKASGPIEIVFDLPTKPSDTRGTISNQVNV